MEAYLLNLVILISIYSILGVTLNFIMGYAGIYSLAHAVFFGVGAYAGTFMAMHVNASIFVTLPVAMAAGAILSLILALPALRVRGEYFVAASLGLQVLAVTIFSEWKSVTGGIGGLIGIPPLDVAGFEVFKPSQFIFVTVGALIIILFIINRLVHSSFGRSLRAIRDSESAAAAFGKNVPLIKTISVVISSALTAVAGVLYASYLSFINVESFKLDTSVLIMAMVIIGGTGTQAGPIVGAALLLLLPSLISYLDFLPQTEIGSIQQIIYGLGMALLMIYRPGGIVGRKKQSETGKE
ncbi:MULTISPECIES: branched-chain amino acid ABC transporter permease [unclassified Sneathiella]|uniref:branched-chain amino acid ABC transporter permease n=1 Tax=unclassified Sneathiella TaxID=2614935 RepID=UPI001D152D17|nr:MULTISPECIES: branched-chain amino acid ABC transporter permease [unclassified Sneathiella]MCC3306323.1 branched-chain amino acid ABC transporter permease [Sneathiella sp. HT1-7]MDF2369078.1 branched-chain amino acid ABC transporter permease [Sneathiella sp.]